MNAASSFPAPAEAASGGGAFKAHLRRERRRAMLEAARSVFGELDYGSATVQRIADRAGFGKGTIYNYFPGGKREMIDVLFQELSDELCRYALPSARSDADGLLREAVQGYLTDFIAYFLDHPAAFALVVRNGSQPVLNDSSTPSTLQARLHEQLIGHLAPLLKECLAEAKKPRLMPAPATTALLVGAAWTYLYSDCYDPEARPPRLQQRRFDGPEEAASMIAGTLFDGLYANPTSC